MRFDTLTRAAFAALLMAALWLPAASAQTTDDERALAARAYARIQPALREMMKKAYADSLASGEPSALDGCEAASKRQARADLERDTTALVLELFFSEQMQRRVEDILVDVYDAEQLRMTAEGGNAPSRPEQSAKIASSFRELSADFLRSVSQDSRFATAMVDALQNAREQLKRCRAEQGAG